MGRFSLCSWLPYLILIVQLNVLPWMLNLIIVQLCPQPLLFHTVLCVCVSISFWRIYKNNFICKSFCFMILLLHETTSLLRAGLSQPYWLACTVNMWLCDKYSWRELVDLEVEGDLSWNLICTPEFGQQAVVYWTYFTRVRCQIARNSVSWLLRKVIIKN